MIVAKARCHVVRTIARGSDQREDIGTAERCSHETLQHISVIWPNEAGMYILKPIVSKRYLLKRMTLEDREIQELQQ